MTTLKIDRIQYFFMIPNILFAKAIGITAGVMVRNLGADTWLSMAMGFAIGTLIVLLMVYLCSKFQDKTILEIAEQLLGKWAVKLIGGILAIYFILAYGASANVMTLHVNEYFLPSTPFAVICVLYTLLCMYAVFLGIEVVIRFSLVGFIMLLLINIAMITGTVQDVQPVNLLPIMDKGFIRDLAGSVYIFGDLSMIILAIGFLYPMMNRKKKPFKLTLWAMVTAFLMVIVWPLFETMVMGPELMKQYVVVCMQQIRNAQLTKYLPRYELIMVSFFSFGLLVQSAAMFYCAKHCIKHIAGVKKDWHVIVPLAAVLCGVTYIMANDHNNYINFLAYPYSQICTILSIGLPGLLILAALFRGKLKKNEKRLNENETNQGG